MHRVKISSVIFLTVLAVLFAVPHSYSGVPQLINYQGKLTNAGGSQVPDGSYDVEFKIYDVATGGTALWSETWNSGTSQVTTKGGVFNALLGKYNPIPVTFFADHSVTYLGITVGSDSEMTPRQRITSVGYAFEAANGVPRGAIIMWSGSISEIPAGWALCDGTNGTPDLRSRFIVGAGSEYGVGSTGGNSSVNLAHTHSINATDINHTHSGTTGGPSGDIKRKGSDDLSCAVKDHHHDFTTSWMNQNSSHTHTESSQLSSIQDIRPPYYALAFIMKL
jgi:hypothetical protein